MVIEDKMAKTVVEILRAAARHMKQHGYCKNDLRDSRGRVCIAGAINFVLTGNETNWPPRTRPILDRIGRYLGRKNKCAYIEPVSWNNASGRKQKEVIAAIYGAARKAAHR
jgi:hypothetical protein